jgi:hypothetical protein
MLALGHRNHRLTQIHTDKNKAGKVNIFTSHKIFSGLLPAPKFVIIREIRVSSLICVHQCLSVVKLPFRNQPVLPVFIPLILPFSTIEFGV